MKKKLLIMLALIFVLSGCGEKDSNQGHENKEPNKVVENEETMESTQEEQNVEDAKQTVEKVFENLKTLNFKEAEKNINVEEIKQFISTELTYMDAEEFMNEWFDTLGCEIVSAENVDDSNVSVSVKITSRDMKELLLKHNEAVDVYVEDNIDMLYAYSQDQRAELIQSKSTELFGECVKNEEYTSITSSVTLNISNTEGTWIISVDNDLRNALLGDLTGAKEALGFTVTQ